MLVRAQVIDDSPALLAKDHISVKAPRFAGGKVSNPGHGFPPVFVYIRIVSDREGYRPSTLRKHDTARASEIKKGQGIRLSVPKLFHRSRANACETIGAAEPEPFVNTRREKLEPFAQRLFVDGSHGPLRGGSRWQRLAVGTF